MFILRLHRINADKLLSILRTERGKAYKLLIIFGLNRGKADKLLGIFRLYGNWSKAGELLIISCSDWGESLELLADWLSVES